MEADSLETNKLSFCIDVEQKRYDSLDKSFGEAKNRRLLLLSAEFAIFAFLFSDLQSLLPTELYGMIFFAIGIFAGVGSITLSFYHCRPIIWPDPIGPTEEAKISASQTEAEWKTVVLEDYRSANQECKRLLSLHARTLKWSLILFVISITILLIIKFF